MPRFDEVTTDFLVARQASLAQHSDRLRRGRGVSTNDVWHLAGYPLTTVGIAGLALNTLIAIPFINGAAFPLRAIANRVTGAGAAGSVLRIGIYDMDDLTTRPLNLVADSGQIDGTVAPVFNNIPINVTLGAGLVYYFVTLIGVAAPTILGAATWIGTHGWAVNFAAVANGWQVAQAFGPLPAIFPAGATLATSNYPLVGVLGQ